MWFRRRQYTSSSQHPYFEHEGHEIVTILDPPHLLKCFRNNFLKHDVQFTQDLQIDGKERQGWYNNVIVTAKHLL